MKEKKVTEDYNKTYEQKRKESQSRLPTVYLSKGLRQSLDDLSEVNNANLKDVIITGALLVKMLDESFDCKDLFVEGKYKITREEYEELAVAKLTDFLAKNGINLKK